MANNSVQMIGQSIAGAVQMAGTVVLSPVLRSWYNRWGATGEEISRSLPGDELVPQPMRATHGRSPSRQGRQTSGRGSCR